MKRKFANSFGGDYSQDRFESDYFKGYVACTRFNEIDSSSYVHKLLKDNKFDILYETKKHESGENVIGEDGNDAVYIIARKRII